MEAANITASARGNGGRPRAVAMDSATGTRMTTAALLLTTSVSRVVTAYRAISMAIGCHDIAWAAISPAIQSAAPDLVIATPSGITPASRKITSQDTPEYRSSFSRQPQTAMAITPAMAVTTIGRGVRAAASTTASTMPPASHMRRRSKSSSWASSTTTSGWRRSRASAVAEALSTTTSPTCSFSSASRRLPTSGVSRPIRRAR